MSAHDGTPNLLADAEQIPDVARTSALRHALTHAHCAQATLNDLSAALREAGRTPGLIWEADYVAAQAGALADAIAEAATADHQPAGTADRVEGDRQRTD